MAAGLVAVVLLHSLSVKNARMMLQVPPPGENLGLARFRSHGRPEGTSEKGGDQDPDSLKWSASYRPSKSPTGLSDPVVVWWSCGRKIRRFQGGYYGEVGIC